MAALTGAFFDTSVLVSGLVDQGEASRGPQALFDALAAEEPQTALTAWHCCLELYSVLTRLPPSLRVDSTSALQLLREEILARFEVHQMPPGAHRPFLDAVAAEELTGGQIYDAHIAAVAHHSGARVVVTDNRRHFTSLLRHGIPVLTAAELAEELA